MACVLVVEDDVDLQFVIDLLLRRAGHEVVTAGHGQAALDTMARRIPDAVILDWMMPGLSGPEVCRELRAMPGGDRVAVLMLTVRVGPDDEMEAFRAGVDDYMIKPFDHEEFTRRVQDLLERVARTRSGP
ncbi:response regulator transcription factor [Planomonospora corallina]|uniref:Response regulator transcription factor n=1 Tax=Planomonospora corallina TaxID=1806052 RepID=A0ABV8I9N0_9ACTN